MSSLPMISRRILICTIWPRIRTRTRNLRRKRQEISDTENGKTFAIFAVHVAKTEHDKHQENGVSDTHG